MENDRAWQGASPGYLPGEVAKACPHCSSDLLRIPRRPTDRLTSLVRPVHRYRCQYFSCGWEGNLRASRADFAHSSVALASDPFAPERIAGSPKADKLPRSFVLSMVLTVAGIVLVLFASTTDWLSEAGLAEHEGPHDPETTAAGGGARLPTAGMAVTTPG